MSERNLSMKCSHVTAWIYCIALCMMTPIRCRTVFCEINIISHSRFLLSLNSSQACRDGADDIVNRLIEQGADPQLLNSERKSALHYVIILSGKRAW